MSLFIGPQGEMGPVGEPGPAGQNGMTGANGDQGERGDSGGVGPAGPQGPQGFRVSLLMCFYSLVSEEIQYWLKKTSVSKQILS